MGLVLKMQPQICAASLLAPCMLTSHPEHIVTTIAYIDAVNASHHSRGPPERTRSCDGQHKMARPKDHPAVPTALAPP